jgi:hypothetical protein
MSVLGEKNNSPTYIIISRLLSHPKVGELSKKTDALNPKRESTTGEGGPDIFEMTKKVIFHPEILDITGKSQNDYSAIFRIYLRKRLYDFPNARITFLCMYCHYI